MPNESLFASIGAPDLPGAWYARIMRALTVVWIFALVLALSPITQDPAGPPKYALTAVIAALTAAVWLLGNLRGGSRTIPDGWIGWSLILFLLVHGLAPAFCEQPWRSLYTVVPWISFTLMAFMMPAACERIGQVRMLFGGIVAAVACSSLYAVAQRAGFDPFPWAITDRYEYTGLPSTYGHPNFAGHALVIALCCGIALADGPRRRLLWLLPAVALLAWHLNQTGMRAGILALAAAAAVLVLAKIVRRLAGPTQAPLALVGILLGVAATGVLAATAWLEGNPRVTLPIDSAWILRLNSFQGAAAMFFERPLAGFGPGRYSAENPLFWSLFEQRWFNLYHMKNDHVHNELLETALETGVAGAASLLAVWLVALFRSAQLAMHPDRAARRLGEAFLAAFTAIIVDGQFGFNLHTPVSGGLFFLLLGLLFAVHARREPVSMITRVFTSFNQTLLAAGAAAALLAGFHMEWMHQRARGAWEWADTFEGINHADAAMAAARSDLIAASSYPFAGARLWKDLARTQDRLGDTQSAASAYREAVSIEPYDPDLLADQARFLARIAENPAEFEAARQPAQAALDICEDFAPAYGALAVAASRQGKLESSDTLRDEARSYWRDEVKYTRETHPGLWWLAADQAIESGDYDYAIEIASRSVRAQPEHSPSWKIFRRVFEADGRTERWRLEASRALAVALRQERLPAYGAGCALDLMSIERSLGTGLESEYLALALPAYPNRMALWGAVAESAPPGAKREALAAWRARLDIQDPKLLQALEPLDRILAALEDADWEKLRSALDTVSTYAHAMDTAGSDDLIAEWAWLGRLCESELENHTLPLEVTASVLLPVVDMDSAIGAHDEVLRISTLIGPYLDGQDLGRVFHARSLAFAAQGSEEAALTAARQAAALVPSALPIRWNLAVRLWKAGRLAEAEFEFNTQLARMDRTVPGYSQMIEEYQAFKREQEGQS
ncbi:MAG: hypothetical protein GC168_13940 [Candidatus Hydrogenedens sp.]|nr:hypothetical protein [Candidatus Hydrogenedens sp.]